MNEVDRLRRAYASLGETASFGAACPDAGRIWDTVTGGASAAEARAVVLHAASCGACGNALRLAREIAAGMALEARPRSRGAWPGRVALIAASLLIVAIGAWLLSPTEAPRRIADVPIAKAAYDPRGEDGLVWRGEDSPARALFDQGMEAYGKDDFARAADLLAGSLELEPDHAGARFYRGVSLLLLGDPGAAIPNLDAAARGSAGPLRDEARWYLALAALRAGEQAKARRVLDELAVDGGKRREEAAKLGRDLEGGR